MAGNAGPKKKARVSNCGPKQHGAQSEVRVNPGIKKSGWAKGFGMAAKDPRECYDEVIGAYCARMEAAGVESEASRTSLKGAEPSHNTRGHSTVRSSATQALPCMPRKSRHSQSRSHQRKASCALERAILATFWKKKVMFCFLGQRKALAYSSRALYNGHESRKMVCPRYRKEYCPYRSKKE